MRLLPVLLLLVASLVQIYAADAPKTAAAKKAAVNPVVPVAIVPAAPEAPVAVAPPAPAPVPPAPPAAPQEDEGEWELIYPKTTAALGALAAAGAAVWSSDNVDLFDSNGGPDNGAAAAKTTAKSVPAEQAETRIQIFGTFQGSARGSVCGLFVPSLSFAGDFSNASQAGSGAGGIASFVSSQSCGAPEGASGAWQQIGAQRIRISVNDAAYAGEATVQGGAIVLATGEVLRPVGSASAVVSGQGEE